MFSGNNYYGQLGIWCDLMSNQNMHTYGMYRLQTNYWRLWGSEMELAFLQPLLDILQRIAPVCWLVWALNINVYIYIYIWYIYISYVTVCGKISSSQPSPRSSHNSMIQSQSCWLNHPSGELFMDIFHHSWLGSPYPNLGRSMIMVISVIPMCNLIINLKYHMYHYPICIYH